MDNQLPSAASLHLVGGCLCLDFANTADWHASEQPVELLRTYADLVEWAVHVGILAPEEAAAPRALERAEPADAARVLARARELREAIYRIFTDVACGAVVSPADLAVLNDTLGTAMAHRRIARDGAEVVWRWDELGAALDGLLWPVALSAAELLVGPERARVGCCAADRCGWLFLDTSKSGRRRWCSMESCGNRAKARRHYHRQRTTSTR